MALTAHRTLVIKDGILVKRWDVIQDEAAKQRAIHQRAVCSCSEATFQK
jgi:hypothetical protein